MIACYLRVSTEDQNTDSQVPDVERWLSNHGHDRDQVRWYEDKESGATLARPAFEELQKAIFMGEIETVVIWHTDRLIRNHRQGVNLIHDWCDKGIRLVSVNQQLDLDSTIGKAVAGLLFAIGQDDREKIRMRQAAGIKIAKKKGIYEGRKLGSLKSPDGPAKVAELRKKGVKVKDICAALSIGETTYKRYRKLAVQQGYLT